MILPIGICIDRDTAMAIVLLFDVLRLMFGYAVQSGRNFGENILMMSDK